MKMEKSTTRTFWIFVVFAWKNWPVKSYTWKEFTAWICSKHGTSETYRHDLWVWYPICPALSHESIFFPCSLLQPSPQWWASSPRSPCQCELPLAKTEPRKKKKWWIIDEVPDKSVALYSEIFENRYIECQWYLSRPPAVKWYCSMMLAHVSQIKAAIIPV